jgi:hypothetical protein
VLPCPSPPADPKSLHYLNPAGGLTKYEEAIMGVGKVRPGQQMTIFDRLIMLDIGSIRVHQLVATVLLSHAAVLYTTRSDPLVLASPMQVLEFYDSDRAYPAFGFGGQKPPYVTNHCFHINGQPNPVCIGMDGICAAYRWEKGPGWQHMWAQHGHHAVFRSKARAN